MPPKKDTSADSGIAGYDLRETKLLAAAFLSSTGPDKYNYPLFAQLSGFTEGTLKKFWPPVKKKGIENHENFGTFLMGGSAAPATAPKAAAGKKRKAADADAADVDDSKASGKPMKAPAKGNGRGKKVKTEEPLEEPVNEDSADGGDGLEVA
ncbi:uncharacterized protein EKO05_0006928 [Ascochyta rabiei]|uniref:DNA binding n=1 Tax=Didymella rabiei TaxID=5454 RepID=A0A162Z308_DIDRA|nr:uncharacterized protein EKO05_0006928 [Ascochyta rabiei]KZM20370.1 DNA binding [Ascochyta rabiei]UPX16532.1 hypothetical protein EKO05_0006928 [Ascochyta rabiei]